MALIVCPECGGNVSDRAPACPHCGYPIPQLPEYLFNQGTIINLSAVIFKIIDDHIHEEVPEVYQKFLMLPTEAGSSTNYLYEEFIRNSLA